MFAHGYRSVVLPLWPSRIAPDCLGRQSLVRSPPSASELSPMSADQKTAFVKFRRDAQAKIGFEARARCTTVITDELKELRSENSVVSTTH